MIDVIISITVLAFFGLILAIYSSSVTATCNNCQELVYGTPQDDGDHGTDDVISYYCTNCYNSWVETHEN